MKGNPEDAAAEAQDEIDEQWQQLDEKVILAQILTELTQIRALLSGADSGRSRQSEESDEYECVKCGKVMPRGDCARHAESEHRAPPGEWQSLFDPA